MRFFKFRFLNREKQKQKIVYRNQETLSKCFCFDCPTVPDERGLYCEQGVKKKPIEEVNALGCDCVFCSVYHGHNIKGCYQCLNRKI